MEPAFFETVPTQANSEERLASQFAEARSYEDALDRARIFGQEQKFLIGVRILTGSVSVAEAGFAYTRLAETLISRLFARVCEEFAKTHGTIDGGACAVVAMGKLGGCEMTAASDLDLMLLYDADPLAESKGGGRPISTQQYYGRLTQRLISALSAPTAEGLLYEADFRLRPSGNSGPLAVSLAAFSDYQAHEAWTWEHMALTRARVVAGPEAFAQSVEAAIRAALTRPRDAQKLKDDVLSMRRRIEKEKGATSPWEVKQVPGGLIDVEFVAQYLMLLHGPQHPELFSTNTTVALQRVKDAGLSRRRRGGRAGGGLKALPGADAIAAARHRRRFPSRRRAARTGGAVAARRRRARSFQSGSAARRYAEADPGNFHERRRRGRRAPGFGVAGSCQNRLLGHRYAGFLAQEHFPPAATAAFVQGRPGLFLEHIMSHARKNARSLARAALGATALAALLAMSAVGATSAVAKTLAKVNGVEITDEDLKLAMEDLGAAIPRQLEGKARETYVLDFLIDEQLVVQKAQADKLAETPEFAKKLAYLRDKALMETLLGDVAKNAATEAAVKQTYDEAAKNQKPETEYHAHHILVPTEEEAKAALKRVKARRGFRQGRDRTFQGPRRQGRRSRLVHQGPHGAGVRRRGGEDGAGSGLRSDQDAIRLAHHQARREAPESLPAAR